jgi:hypothetical protein
MRYTALLLLITIVMSFLTGKAFYTMTGDLDSITLDREELAATMRAVEHLEPDTILDFNVIFKAPELYTTSSFFTDLLLQGSPLKKLDFSDTTSCQFRDYPILLAFQAKQKYSLWFDFLCGQLKRLPDGFFEQPPFVHPSGTSYAWLAVKTKAQYEDEQWILDHLAYFKLDEFSQLNQPLPAPYQLFQELNSSQQIFFLQQRSFFLINNFLVLHPKKRLKDFFEQFWGSQEHFNIKLISLKKINTFLEKTPYTISWRKKNSKCLIKQNNVCWRYSLKYYFSYASSTTIFVLILSLLLLVIVVVIFLQKLKEERRHEGNQRLALQILSHEFRTPISSLVLQNELLSKFRDKFPPEAEENLMEISSNIFRLQRLAEMSKSYLLASRQGKFNLQLQVIRDLKGLIESVTDEFSEEQFEFYWPEKIYTIKVDPFWFQLELKNLISNAIKYGKPPIIIRVEFKHLNMIVSVEDQGECSITSLRQITGEFIREGDNKGMGLGLNIVKRAMEGVGGELKYKRSPTTFSLHFSKVVVDE